MSTQRHYNALSGVRWSALKHMDHSPAEYRRRLEIPHRDTDALRMGRLVDCLVFTPDAFDARYSVWDGPESRATKVYKAWAAEQPDGVELWKANEVAAARRLAAAVRAHPWVADMAPALEHEPVLQWTDEATGLQCKGLPDLGTGVLMDLKTMRSTRPGAVGRAVMQYGYHGQLAHYEAGVEAMTGHAPPCYLICVEKGTNDVGVFHVGEEEMAVGRDLRRRLLDQLAQCLESDTWPTRYGDGVHDLRLPRWAYLDEEDGLDLVIGEDAE